MCFFLLFAFLASKSVQGDVGQYDIVIPTGRTFENTELIWNQQNSVFFEQEPNDPTNPNQTIGDDNINTYYWWKGINDETYFPERAKVLLTKPYQITIWGEQHSNDDIDQFAFFDLNQSGKIKCTIIEGSWEYLQVRRCSKTAYARMSGYDDTQMVYENVSTIKSADYEFKNATIAEVTNTVEFEWLLPRSNFPVNYSERFIFPLWDASNHGNRVGFPKFMLKPSGPYKIRFEFIPADTTTSSNNESSDLSWGWMGKWPWVYMNEFKNWVYYNPTASGLFMWNYANSSWYKWSDGIWVKQ